MRTLQATYEFWANRRIKASSILSAHTTATIERIKKHQVVLAIQDKIELDLGERQRTKGNLQPENLGLTLAQAKELLLQTQRSIASQQIAQYQKQQELCSHFK